MTAIVACFPYLLLGLNLARAQNYAAQPDNSHWTVDKSVRHCRLSHEIPGYGIAEFSQASGDKPSFSLKANIAAAKAGDVSLWAQGERWSDVDVADYEAGQKRLIGRVFFEATLDPIKLPNLNEGANLNSKLNTKLKTKLKSNLHSNPIEVSELKSILASGKSIFFSTPDKVDNITISHVEFLSGYDQYQSCIAEMLPVGFDTLKLTRLYFESNSAEITPESKMWLERILRQLRDDPAITAIEIGGHSDRVGGYTDNRLLANRRMWAVKDYLVFRGVSQNLITLRSYSDSKPIASNGNAKGRAKNRRVEVELFH